MEIIDKGKGNQLIISKNSSGTIQISGNNNKIVIPENIEKIDFIVEGNNSFIELKEKVKVIKKLHIRIADNNCVINIGEGTTIHELNILVNEDNNRVEIGEDCMISSNVRILTSDSHAIILKKNNKCINYHKTGVKIGNHVWLGMNALILKDVQLGNNVVVAAGAVVTNKENKNNIVLAGNPAKIIKEGIDWERRLPKKTEEIEKTKIEGIAIEGNIKSFIEKKTIDEKQIKISGWAYIENVDSVDSDIYFEIKSKRNSEVYKTQTNKRMDISEIYGEQYINSGFDIMLLKNKKLKNIEQINIVIKNKDKIYKNKIFDSREAF